MHRPWPPSLAVLASLSMMPAAANDERGTSFEEQSAGLFDELETAVGTWRSGAGRVLVDDAHARTGRHCLQLTGGEETVVTLEIAPEAETSGVLSFWAERWTQRAPFSFRVEVSRGAGWEEVYDGDARVRVGRAFLNHVEVPLHDADIERLRFRCTSPPDTGILIDDVRIAPARPQEIVRVEAASVTLPALVGNEACPLLRVEVEAVGQLDPISLIALDVSLEGTADLADLVSVQVHLGSGPASRFAGSERIATVDAGALRSDPLALSWPDGARPLAEGVNSLWIACQLAGTADIDRRVGAACRRLHFSNGEVVDLDAAPAVQRMGVALRRGGDDGVHTYRIPGLATTNEGSLIGVYDVRWSSGGDLPGDIDVGMSRSTDHGRTWEPMKIVMDMGDDPAWRHDGIGDPAVLVDRGTGTIWIVATWSHGNRSWIGSGPGLEPEETGQLMMVRSDDDGRTWSAPINLTAQVKKPQWCFLLQGPGKGITMRDGTIVFAAQYQDPPERKRLPHSTILYSRDHGETWRVGAGAFDDTTEAQVVEVEPGVLMLNCRYNRGGVRVVMTTRDMGETWQEHPTSRRSLIEPRACMASLLGVDQEAGEELGGWLLFSNPDSASGRHHITIKASPDGGLSWPEQRRLLLDEGVGGGYSCMTMIDPATVGILYEGSQADLSFQRVPLADLVGGEGAAREAESGRRGGAGAGRR